MLSENYSRFLLVRLFLSFLVFSTTNSVVIYPQNSTNYVSKKGGICFRTDDNQPIWRYLEYAALFNNYNQKFSLAINFGKSSELTPDYISGLQQIQASGHEIMDHTPKHCTNYFYTILSTDYYVNHPGVYRISGSKIELKYDNVNLANAKRTGYVNINGDTVISTSGIFSDFSKADCYLYFPAIGQLVFIGEFDWIDQNRVKINDFWGNYIDLGTRQDIQFYNFDWYGIHLTTEGLKALAEESIRMASYYNLERPFAWIQPGGYFPRVFRNEVKQACGDALGYKSAGIFSDYSLKVFNEYNPDNDKQFGMNWGDFRDDIWTLQQCKEYIANRIAKHYVLIGLSHFAWGELLGGWTGFLDRTEQLLQWCIQNNIPIKTYSEWADVLYKQTPDPYENIFPPLNVDLDSNNIPDGFNDWGEGILNKTDGVPITNDYCYSINKVGEICSIRDLGGVEKGKDDFEIWTKGAQGDFIEVTFKVGKQNFVYKFPAENSEWTRYNLTQSVNGNTSLNIPQDISLIDVTISCSNYSLGEVKISGIRFSKPPIVLKANLFLEGPYNTVTNQMSTTINSIIPTTSPYTQDPRTVSVIPPDIVDWVLIELRSTPSGPSVVSKSVFLNKNGNLVADDGLSQNIFLNVPPVSYYIVVKHRNHLAIMSVNAVELAGDTLMYDFTTGDGSQFYPGTGIGAKELATNVWGMIAGDGTANGSITASDNNTVWLPQFLAGEDGYKSGDYNLSGSVTASDNNLNWLINNGTDSQVP
jgi:hypothetical protein